APAGAGGHAVRRPRRPPDRAPAGGSVDGAVPLPGPGHDGDDRPAGGGGRAAGPGPPAGDDRLAGRAGPPPAVPRRPAEPAVGAAQLGLGLPAVGPGAPDHPAAAAVGAGWRRSLIPPGAPAPAGPPGAGATGAARTVPSDPGQLGCLTSRR